MNPTKSITSNENTLRTVKRACILLLLIFVLAVNGAIPGLLTPTLGQAVWLTGFAKSLLNTPNLSIFSYDIGLPTPAAIAFGLPGTIVTAVGLRAGLLPPDAYSLACLFWLAIAFWGAYRLSRHFGCSSLYGAFGAAIWLTFPIVWQHTGYSMLSIGIALLPTYYYSFLKVIEASQFRNIKFAGRYLVFLFFSTVSAFMDGYTFAMFASACTATLFFFAYYERKFSTNILRSTLTVFGFLIAAIAYNSYIPSIQFKDGIDHFRGWGVDISFLVIPPKGVLWLPDFLGLSADRSGKKLFGDASVYLTTFSIVPTAIAFAFFFSTYGSRRWKLLFLGIGLIATYLALGPSFKINSLRPPDFRLLSMPAEYALGPTGTRYLWENVPGFYNMRAAYRWMALALVGFWGAIIASLADKNLPRNHALAAVFALLVCNLPHLPALWNQYSNNRLSFLKLDEDLTRDLGNQFHAKEKIAFLPAGNDFLVNFLAPRLNIRSYNIGGDKNGFIARANWPPEMQKAAKSQTSEELAESILDVLNGPANAVAIPYIDLLWAAHRWPFPLNRLEKMQPIVQMLRQSSLFDVVETKYFAVVRLSENAKVTPHNGRREIFISELCHSINQIQLTRDSPLSFSNRNSLCGFGWSHIEGWGRWTDGPLASLQYVLPEANTKGYIELDVHAYLGGAPPRQRVRVRVNGTPGPDWIFAAEANSQIRRLRIPDKADQLKIEFDLPDARSPKDAGQSTDGRLLGIGIRAICLTEEGKTCLIK